jgi:hypothetical protein
MIRKELLIGISVAALAAGTAAAPAVAQNNTSTGNCSTASGGVSPGGTCVINNNAVGNTNNQAFIDQTGEGNFGRVEQLGDDNVGIIDQDGVNNNSEIRQAGDDHRAISDQDGEENVSDINQGDDENSATVVQNGDFNRSLVQQGTGQTGVQSGSLSQANATNSASIAQNSGLGENNVASVTQNGTNLLSDIRQSQNVFGDTANGGGFAFAPADENSATVQQSGSGSLSQVFQIARGGVARVFMFEGGENVTGSNARNTSRIDQRNSIYSQNASGTIVGANRGANNPTMDNPSGEQPVTGRPTATTSPTTNNVADVSIRGLQNSSVIDQLGVFNTATVSMLGGGTSNTGPTPTPGTTPGGNTFPANRKEGNASTIFQYGRNNGAFVSSGGLGGQGNVSLINQGTQVDFNGTAQGFNGDLDFARGHQAFVWQRGLLDNVNIVQENRRTADIPTTAANEGNLRQDSSLADVSQISRNSAVILAQFGTNSATVSQARNRNGTGGDLTANIRQVDAGDFFQTNTDPNDPFPDSSTQRTTARNTVGVSQSGIENVTTIDQNARNAVAFVWQQISSFENLAEIEQGTGTQTTTENNFAPGQVGPQGGFLSGSNSADVAPGGTSNAATVDASDTGINATNLTADITQSGGGGVARLRQDGQNLSALVTQAGTRASGGVAVDSDNFVGISQINAFNSATVSQNGFLHSATVDQRGTGRVDPDGVTRRNTVTIQQEDDRHRAVARQLATVGPSANDPDTAANEAPRAGPAPGSPEEAAALYIRAAGRQSAEIVIIQNNDATTPLAAGVTDPGGNDAFVEQQGRGQFARIEQRGRGNNAGIIQGNDAHNAVATILQDGHRNSYYIVQTQAGQYQQVTQIGNDNVAGGTSSVTGGPASNQPGNGTSGTTSPGAFFPF